MVWIVNFTHILSYQIITNNPINAFYIYNDFSMAVENAMDKISSFLIEYVEDINMIYNYLDNNYRTNDIKQILNLNNCININYKEHVLRVDIIKKEIIYKTISCSHDENKITSVPLNTIVSIMWKYLDCNNIIKLSKVNKQINNYLSSNTVWNTFLQKHFNLNIRLSFVDVKQIYKRIYSVYKYKIIGEYLEFYLIEEIPESFVLTCDYNRYIEKASNIIDQKKYYNKKVVINKLLKMVDQKLGVNNIDVILNHINQIYKVPYIDKNNIKYELGRIKNFIDILHINSKLLEFINNKYILRWNNINPFISDIFAKFKIDNDECFISGHICGSNSLNKIYIQGVTISFSSDSLNILEFL